MAEKFEASMNFDLENVRPFLEQLDSALALGLEVDRLTRLVETTALDTLNGTSFQVHYLGETVDVLFSAYIDDLDAPDLYFYVSSQPLAQAIDHQMAQFCEKMGI